ncbi:MAG: hypothetical protein AAGD01_13535 [Acidobacteriota bacterium]
MPRNPQLIRSMLPLRSSSEIHSSSAEPCGSARVAVWMLIVLLLPLLPSSLGQSVVSSSETGAKSALAPLFAISPLVAEEEDWEDEDEEEAEERAEEAREARIMLLQSMAEAHFEKSELLREDGRFEEAIAELEQLRALPFPEEAEMAEELFGVDITIIELYLENQRPEKAKGVIRQALERNAERPARLALLHNMLGRVLREQDRRTEALKHFNLAIELGRQALESGDSIH